MYECMHVCMYVCMYVYTCMYLSVCNHTTTPVLVVREGSKSSTPTEGCGGMVQVTSSSVASISAGAVRAHLSLSVVRPTSLHTYTTPSQPITPLIYRRTYLHSSRYVASLLPGLPPASLWLTTALTGACTHTHNCECTCTLSR